MKYTLTSTDGSRTSSGDTLGERAVDALLNPGWKLFNTVFWLIGPAYWFIKSVCFWSPVFLTAENIITCLAWLAALLISSLFGLVFGNAGALVIFVMGGLIEILILVVAISDIFKRYPIIMPHCWASEFYIGVMDIITFGHGDAYIETTKMF